MYSVVKAKGQMWEMKCSSLYKRTTRHQYLWLTVSRTFKVTLYLLIHSKVMKCKCWGDNGEQHLLVLVFILV